MKLMNEISKCVTRPFTLRTKIITIKKNHVKLRFKRIAANCIEER